MGSRGVEMQDHSVRQILADLKDVTRRVGPTWARVRAGDLLWVRETFALLTRDPDREPTGDPQRDVVPEYRADGDARRLPGSWPPEHRGAPEVPRWRSPRFMPRWASRVDLEVLSVTVQRPPLALVVDDAEARREGFADAVEFLAAWVAMHPDYNGDIYRIEFRRLGVATT